MSLVNNDLIILINYIKIWVNIKGMKVTIKIYLINMKFYNLLLSISLIKWHM